MLHSRHPPEVSVLMAVWNGASTVENAARSILSQHGVRLELVVVDDGSTDATASILERVADKDPRVRLARNSANLGLTASLNLGLRRCCAPLIARMDADDVAHPQRLRVQLEFMRRHPEVGVLGARTDSVGADGEVIARSSQRRAHEAIVWRLFTYRSSISHPTAVIRRPLLESAGGYCPAFAVAQDFELWHRLLWRTRFANLPRALLHYSIEEPRVSTRRYEEQVAIRQRVMRRALAELLGTEPDEPDLSRHREFFRSPESLSSQDARAASDFASLVGQALIDKGVMRSVAGFAIRRELDQQLELAAQAARRGPARMGLPRRIIRRLRRAAGDAYLAGIGCRF
jgi:glycosyltransferase involved in cell wall biosynthesis